MATGPVVSVVMPVYNGEAYLAEAIGTILGQTFREFEFVIMDDGSTDGSVGILAAFEGRDNRVRVLHQENGGVDAALKAAVGQARGNYIARMDADDTSRPDRLARQVAFMDAHPEVGVCGTWVEAIGGDGATIWRYATDDASIRCRLLFESSLAHPSVMMRRELFFEKGLTYRSEYEPAGDYDLWVQASKQCRLANLPEVLLSYRRHQGQTSQRRRELMKHSTERVREAQLARLGVEGNAEDMAVHHAISRWEVEVSREFVGRVDRWLRCLHAANQRRGVYPEPEFSRALGERWLWVCRRATKLGWWTWSAYWRSPLVQGNGIGRREALRFRIQCALRHGG